jgi:hypothetical protein
MKRKRFPRLIIMMVAAALILGGQSVFAQLRIVGRISGTVEDQVGGVIPNARVVLRDVKTGITKETTSSEHGSFLFPDLSSGLYEITVTATGFQTSVISNISVSTSQTTDVRVKLAVGQVSETVTVIGATEALETTSQLVSSTISTQTLAKLPVLNRSNVLGVIRAIGGPGISPPIGGGNSGRYNNLPGGALNITLDGINNASNGFKSGGTSFFVTVPLRLGAIEEVTVETGGLGADSGAQSGANIKFTTKRGGNKYHGSGFYEARSEKFNANSWTRNAQGLPRVRSRIHEYGGNFGGPLLPFGSFKNKMFVFVNFERFYNPLFNAATISVLTPEAQRGIYTYVASGTTNEIRTANVLDLAAARNLPTKLDPVAQSILAINNQVPQFATRIPDTDLNRDVYTWNADNNFYQYFPTVRWDYHVTPKQQVIFTWNYRHSWQPGARRLPVPDVNRTNPFRIGYFVWSAGLQSTLSPRTFNELRYGVQHSGDTNTRAEYGDVFRFNNVPLRIGGTLPFSGNPAGPLVPFIDQQNVTGRHFITTMYDTLTLNRGEHTITLGGSYRKTVWNDSAEVFALPTYATGTPNGDPLQASQAFTTTTIPGINSTQLGDPVALYNLLTGRVSSAGFTRVVDPDTLRYDGFINFTWTNSLMGGLFVQDRWRVHRSLTLNYGLRWEAQGPMKDGKGLAASPDLASIFGPSKRLFAPGELSGNNNPTLQAGRIPYKTDWLNFAPNFGLAWNPSVTRGLLGKLLGDSKTVIRASYGLISYDEGTQFFAANLGPNVGKFIGATTLVPGQPGQTNLPAFLTLSDIAANPLTVSSFAFAATEYKQVTNQADQTFARTFNAFDPRLRAPYTVNWSFGIQRELWKNNVLEVRYVGNQSKLAWRTSNLNEVNIFENGFLQEFKNAKRNLDISRAQNRGARFDNQGLPGQVPLPIFQAAFGPRGNVPAIAAGSGFSSTGFVSSLDNGAAGAIATTLATNQNYVCRMFGNTFSPCVRIDPRYNAAGPYPINFFLLNPYVAGRLGYVDDTGWHSYNGLQVEFRQRLTQGLTWTTNYTWSKSLTNLPADGQNMSLDFTTLRNTDLDIRESQFDRRHVVQMHGTYDLPIGRGRWLSVDNRILDGVVGGWTMGSIFVFTTGAPIQLTGGFQTVNNTNSAAAGGVRLAPGVTLNQIQEMFNAERSRLTGRAGTTDLQRLAVDPRLIGPDGRANPQFLVPNTTPGEFGQLLFLRGRNQFQWDVSVSKNFQVTEQGRLEILAGFTNVLNTPSWGFPNTNVFSTSFGVVGAPGGGRSMNLRATLSF